MPKRIGIDVDGVAADLHTPWLRRLGARIGRKISPDDMTQWAFWDDFGVTAELVWDLYTPDIYDDVQPYPGVLEALQEIAAAGHTIVFVTQSISEAFYQAKLAWLHHHGLIFGNTEVYPVGRNFRLKHKGEPSLGLDVLVDDTVENLDESGVYGILMTLPHNRRVITRHRRAKSLTEVAALLKWYDKPEPLLKPAGSTLDEISDSYNYAADHCVAPAGLASDGAACWTKPPLAGGGCTITPESVTAPEASPASTSPLPTSAQERKGVPLVTGLLDYFPAALAEVAKISVAGNKQHFTNEPLHWDRTKSTDHADSAVRHLVDRGTFDTDGKRHSAKAAWRALALLQEELEEAGAPPSRASTFTSNSLQHKVA